MTREEAIHFATCLKNNWTINFADMEDFCDMAIEALTNVQNMHKAERWIPCSERLPDADVEVLTTTDWSEVLIAWRRKIGIWETEEYILENDEVLAWMPLPKPYKGGDDK